MPRARQYQHAATEKTPDSRPAVFVPPLDAERAEALAALLVALADDDLDEEASE